MNDAEKGEQEEQQQGQEQAKIELERKARLEHEVQIEQERKAADASKNLRARIRQAKAKQKTQRRKQGKKSMWTRSVLTTIYLNLVLCYSRRETPRRREEGRAAQENRALAIAARATCPTYGARARGAYVAREGALGDAARKGKEEESISICRVPVA